VRRNFATRRFFFLRRMSASLPARPLSSFVVDRTARLPDLREASPRSAHARRAVVVLATSREPLDEQAAAHFVARRGGDPSPFRCGVEQDLSDMGAQLLNRTLPFVSASILGRRNKWGSPTAPRRFATKLPASAWRAGRRARQRTREGYRVFVYISVMKVGDAPADQSSALLRGRRPKALELFRSARRAAVAAHAGGGRFFRAQRIFYFKQLEEAGSASRSCSRAPHRSVQAHRRGGLAISFPSAEKKDALLRRRIARARRRGAAPGIEDIVIGTATELGSRGSPQGLDTRLTASSRVQIHFISGLRIRCYCCGTCGNDGDRLRPSPRNRFTDSEARDDSPFHRKKITSVGSKKEALCDARGRLTPGCFLVEHAQGAHVRRPSERGFFFFLSRLFRYWRDARTVGATIGFTRRALVQYDLIRLTGARAPESVDLPL